MQEIIDDQFNWNFPPNTFGADEGQSGTETIFSDEDNLGRESSQNSINNPIKEDEKVLILYADTPLIDANLLDKFINYMPKSDVKVLTVNLEKPFGYGRIIREQAEDCLLYTSPSPRD